MNNSNSETLSAMVDDEVLADEVSATLASLSNDESLRQRWSRYHLIGDAIRGESIVPGVTSIADRLREQLKDEPVLFSPAASRANKPAWHSQWLHYAAGAAVAASVTMMAVMVAPNFIAPEQSGSIELAKVATPAPTTPALNLPIERYETEKSYVAESGTRWSLGKPEVEAKLNGFLVNHKEYASMSSMQGMLPYATVVSYDSEEKQQQR